MREERERGFSSMGYAMGLHGALSGWTQPKSLQVSRGCSPQLRDQWHGDFEGVSGCWGEVTARLGQPVGGRGDGKGRLDGHTAAQ